MNLTDTFIDTLYTMSTRPIPAEVKEEARKCLLDQVGVMIAGAAQLSEQLNNYLDMFDGSEATAIGLGRKASLQNAALVNGISGHVMDYDDGHRFCNVHLGSAVIPAVLAVAEKENKSMDDVIRGIVIGYEAAIRLGSCIQPAHRARGYHASGTAGTIGAAIGVAALLEFDREQMKSALAAACTSAAGILEMQENVSTLKPFNIGRATHDGVTAALIVRAGFRGPLDVLEGKFGFLRAACETHKPEVLSLENDSRYNICGSYHKPYASCRHTHGAAYAALKAVGDNNLNWRDIDRITVDMYGQGVNGHDHTDIPSAVAGKMSVPFCIALVLVTGNIGMNSFKEEILFDPDIVALTKKIAVRADEELTSWVPKRRVARITVIMKNGEAFTAQVDFPLGEPELPMSIEDFKAKVTELCVYAGRTEQNVQEIISKVLSYNGNAADLVKMLA